ncbi:formyltetrahydrofolate deformylase [Denitromonas ohlonensis]|uniref:Formyltetrahydrofolate deformylase n=2 Tax=Denitromonas TaxID=139331 RepID=A0A558CQT2_9RHOO|nr:formyltetrahydrofolate deformylase [Denitromonas ohlonensis]TVT51124.1 MAG: formyltetrahydrofolate deformylase [Denitromonas halophila]TVO68456.1 formyltetrahydrofolate deformylase [Denitromonas ohlonensis]TVO74734.1 formyltetrahydrofolate deformylase [Denitromonas ohlonensis]TVT71273.1 MAG: formyltetrahydrofolate deformylase [Denitromonas halophila]TVT72247.1 MAG: formyltetrahydrofolate deformylase [Denitromonas halophila]
MHRQRFYTLSASCPDRVGIVARVSTFIAEHQGWILETALHAEPPGVGESVGRYFMRIEIRADSLPFMLSEFRERFAPLAGELELSWKITDSAVKKRLVLLVSKQEHCLYDLLARWKSKELDVEIPCVISNHNDLRGFVEWHGISFHHVPVTPDNKAAAYAEVQRLFEEVHGDTMVLARYMQILSPELCAAYPGRILNIHHSFLPSFVGAKPYHQAYEKGVKLIGATCHYVTADLDQGPIIEQDVIRIDHSDAVEDMVRYGRDIEKTVLARGLRYHLEDRVLVHGRKTVVFR